MSIINQMLRDLDARGAASTGVPIASNHVHVATHRLGARVALLLLLTTAGVTAYFALSGGPQASTPPASAVIAKADSAPAVVAPPIRPARQPAQRAPAVSPVVAPAVPEPPAILIGRMAQTLEERQLPALPRPVTQEALIPTGQAVVKKMAELSPEAQAQQHVDDAQSLRRAGKLEAAIGKYRQALELSPGMSQARVQLARLLQESGQPDAALSLLKTGYDQRRDDGLAIAAGRLLADRGQREDALTWLQRAEGLRPSDHALMGALLAQAHRYEDATRAYQRALAADPSQGGWLLGLGLALESLGRHEDARVAYRNALEHGQFKPEVSRFLRERSGESGP